MAVRVGFPPPTSFPLFPLFSIRFSLLFSFSFSSFSFLGFPPRSSFSPSLPLFLSCFPALLFSTVRLLFFLRFLLLLDLFLSSSFLPPSAVSSFPSAFLFLHLP